MHLEHVDQLSIAVVGTPEEFDLLAQSVEIHAGRHGGTVLTDPYEMAPCPGFLGLLRQFDRTPEDLSRNRLVINFTELDVLRNGVCLVIDYGKRNQDVLERHDPTSPTLWSSKRRNDRFTELSRALDSEPRL